MKKHGLNGSTKWIIFLAGALITVGAIWQTIKNNTSRIGDVEDLAINNKDNITSIMKDIQYIREGIDDLKNR